MGWRLMGKRFFRPGKLARGVLQSVFEIEGPGSQVRCRRQDRLGSGRPMVGVRVGVGDPRRARERDCAGRLGYQSKGLLRKLDVTC